MEAEKRLLINLSVRGIIDRNRTIMSLGIGLSRNDRFEMMLSITASWGGVRTGAEMVAVLGMVIKFFLLYLPIF